MREKDLPFGTREDHPLFDIHDNIQQQIFALALQVGVLKLLLKQDSDTALKSIQKIEHLVHLVQLDLKSMRSNLKQAVPSGF